MDIEIIMSRTAAPLAILFGLAILLAPVLTQWLTVQITTLQFGAWCVGLFLFGWGIRKL